MARTPEMVITPSLLDRLIDDDPGSSADPSVTRAQSFRQFKTALRRDLEWLLNTRRIPDEANDYKLVSESLYHYGLPDLSAMSAQAVDDQHRVRESLRDAIEYFEPRLTNVRVWVEPLSDARMLRFRIEGMAMIDPAPEQISFDTVLQLTSGQYEVK